MISSLDQQGGLCMENLPLLCVLWNLMEDPINAEMNVPRSLLRSNILFNTLREKFSPGPGFEPGSPALRAGALTS